MGWNFICTDLFQYVLSVPIKLDLEAVEEHKSILEKNRAKACHNTNIYQEKYKPEMTQYKYNYILGLINPNL